MAKTMAKSWERVAPETFSTGVRLHEMVLEHHIQRYEFAARAIGHERPVRVLDAACGAGYGSRILKERLHPDSSVIGIDHDEPTIEYARERYGGDGVTFGLGSPGDEIDGGPLDAIVSLETLEHLAEPEAALAGFSVALCPQAHLVVSCPVTLTRDLDPFHLRDFSEREIRGLLRAAGFIESSSMEQILKHTLPDLLSDLRNWPADDTLGMPVRKGLLSYYAQNPSVFLERMATFLNPRWRYRTLTLSLRRQGARAKVATAYS